MTTIWPDNLHPLVCLVFVWIAKCTAFCITGRRYSVAPLFSLLLAKNVSSMMSRVYMVFEGEESLDKGGNGEGPKWGKLLNYPQ